MLYGFILGLKEFLAVHSAEVGIYKKKQIIKLQIESFEE